MIRATAVVRKPAVKPDRVADTVTLDHEGRQRRRIALKGEGGLAFLLDLEKSTALNDGDALTLEDGRLVQVKAAPQRLLEVRAENPLRLMRTAWHIGNRHTPAEITADALYIEDDHVLAEMVRGQGCTATPVMRPFKPESGAYAHDCGHDHGHHHGHGHDHHHDHEHHDHARDHAHGHAHGPGCGHEHHGHKHDH
jgi:urease accessory protein